MKIGIIGAGYIGRAVARLAIRQGHEVMLSNSRHPRTLASTMIAIGCKIGTAQMAADFGEVVLLAVPFFAIQDMSPDLLKGKSVLDACNYYPDRDGKVDVLDAKSTTTSEVVANRFSEAKVVKAFNAILEKDIEKDARPRGAPDRRAMPIAGDDPAAKFVVKNLLDNLGFDTVDAGPLSEGWRFERARPAYCVPLNVADLNSSLAMASNTVAEGSWRA